MLTNISEDLFVDTVRISYIYILNRFTNDDNENFVEIEILFNGEERTQTFDYIPLEDFDKFISLFKEKSQ